MATASVEERLSRLECGYDLVATKDGLLLENRMMRWVLSLMVGMAMAAVLVGCNSQEEPMPLVHLQANETVETSTVVSDDTDDVPTMHSGREPMESFSTSTAVPTPTPTVAPSPTPTPDDHGDDFSTATKIDVGVTIAGVISDLDDFDYLRFETEAGKGYVVNVDGEQEVVLYDWSGYLASDQGEDIVWLAWDEEHYVYVGQSEGGYTLSVSEIDYQDLHGDHRRWATRLTLGIPVDGVIGTRWDQDYFSFEAVEGELYTIEASLGSLVDSRITVVNPEEQELAQNDNYADTRGSRLEWIAPSSGEFFVMVESTWNFVAAGSYSLLVGGVELRG